VIKPRYRSERFGSHIGQPTICELLWDGCVVTKLSGTIAAKSMTEDLVLDWQDAEPHQNTVFSRNGAWVCAVNLFSAGLFVLTAITMAVYRKWFNTAAGARAYATRVFPPLVLCMLIVGAGFYLLAPKVSVREGLRPTFARLLQDRDVREQWMRFQSEAGAGSAGDDIAAVRELRRRLATVDNRLVGGKMTFEASPGNYRIVTDNGKLYLVTYDRWGSPRMWDLSRP